MVNLSEFFYEKKGILPGISVVLCSSRQHFIDFAFENFFRQKYPQKELIIVLNKNDMDITAYDKIANKHNNISVYQLDESLSLGDCFKFGVDLARYDYIAKFDDDDFYGSNYLTQVMESFHQTQCDVLGKACYYVYFTLSKTLTLCRENAENQFCKHVCDATLVFKRSVLNSIEIPALKKAGTFTYMQKQIIQKGFKLYSTDRYNFTVQRNPNPKTAHTWHISEEQFLSLATVDIIKKDVSDFLPWLEPEA